MALKRFHFSMEKSELVVDLCRLSTVKGLEKEITFKRGWELHNFYSPDITKQTMYIRIYF